MDEPIVSPLGPCRFRWLGRFAGPMLDDPRSHQRSHGPRRRSRERCSPVTWRNGNGATWPGRASCQRAARGESRSDQGNAEGTGSSRVSVADRTKVLKRSFATRCRRFECQEPPSMTYGERVDVRSSGNSAVGACPPRSIDPAARFRIAIDPISTETNPWPIVKAVPRASRFRG